MTQADLFRELTPIARKGLPATRATAGERLPYLPNVLAFTAQPESRTSRIAGLNEVLKELLAKGEHEYAEAARRLFALDEDQRGTTLAHRDRRAAQALTTSCKRSSKTTAPVTGL